MINLASDGYGSVWQNCDVSCKEAYHSTMMDFHTHVYYEISLILTGNVHSVLREYSVEGEQSRLVFSAPHTPHWIYLASPSLYSRINLCFSSEFVEDYLPEWRTLSRIFGKNGNILLLSDAQRDLCREKLLAIKEERDVFRQRLRIFEFLSYAAEFDRRSSSAAAEPPPYIIDALLYIDGHYSEKIVADKLAWHLGVGRTTLMTAFRRYTGNTLTEYITRARVKKAIPLLAQNISQERVAELVGFGNGGGLIRAFRHCYGMTPRQYMKSNT